MTMDILPLKSHGIALQLNACIKSMYCVSGLQTKYTISKSPEFGDHLRINHQLPWNYFDCSGVPGPELQSNLVKTD